MHHHIPPYDRRAARIDAIAAAKRGARALGVDLNPARVKEARENAS